LGGYTKGFSPIKKRKRIGLFLGVIPFNKVSGTSVRFKPSVSPFANKKLKTLLHHCALTTIKIDTELKAYCERKVAEGKNKMSVINAVRNNLIHRVYAVVIDNRSYEENYVKRCV